MDRNDVDVLGLTQRLITVDSVSRRSNVAISSLLAETLQEHGFVVEWLEFQDDNGEQKVSLVAKCQVPHLMCTRNGQIRDSF